MFGRIDILGALRRLVLAMRATLGIEPLVWLTDIAGLSRRAAVELMRSSTQTLLAAKLRELAKGLRPRHSSSSSTSMRLRGRLPVRRSMSPLVTSKPPHAHISCTLTSASNSAGGTPTARRPSMYTALFFPACTEPQVSGPANCVEKAPI